MQVLIYSFIFDCHKLEIWILLINVDICFVLIYQVLCWLVALESLCLGLLTVTII